MSTNNQIPARIISAAVTTAILTEAWPAFVTAAMSGSTKPTGSGESALPVGHYLGLQPNERTLCISVELTGVEDKLEGGGYEGPEEALTTIVSALITTQLANIKLDAEPLTVQATELASTNTTRYEVNATVKVSMQDTAGARQVLVTPADAAPASLPTDKLKNCWKPLPEPPAVAYTWEQFDLITKAGLARHDKGLQDEDDFGGFINEDAQGLTVENATSELAAALKACGIAPPESEADLLNCFLSPDAVTFLFDQLSNTMFRCANEADFWRLMAASAKEARFAKAELPLSRKNLELGTGPQC